MLRNTHILKAMAEMGSGGVEVQRKKLMEFLAVPSAEPGPLKLFERALERLVKRERLSHAVQGFYALSPGGADKWDSPPKPQKSEVSEQASMASPEDLGFWMEEPKNNG